MGFEIGQARARVSAQPQGCGQVNLSLPASVSYLQNGDDGVYFSRWEQGVSSLK